MHVLFFIAAPTFLTDRQAMEEFVSRSPRSLIEKIRDFFLGFVDEIRAIAERYANRAGSERQEIKALLGMSDELTDIARFFDAALETASMETEAEVGETVFAKGEPNSWSEFPSTGIVLMDAAKYSLTDGDIIEGYLEAVDPKILEAAQMYREDKNAKFMRYKLGDVQTREAEDILRLLGVDVSGYTHNIDKNGFNHIEKRHGPDGKHDRTMADLNDVARMGWIINNYDTIEVSLDKNGEIELSAGYRDANGRPAPKVVYKKRINGTYYLVEAVADNDWKKLWVITAYINKKGTAQAPDAEAPGLTSDNGVAPIPTGSISEREMDVNNKIPPTETRRIEANQPVSGATEAKWSLARNEEFMDNARNINAKTGNVDQATMDQAQLNNFAQMS